MTKKQSILIIDDNQVICETLLLYFESKGFATTAVTSGEEGLSLIQRGQFEVVILDILMPRLNGLDIMRRIQKEKTILPKIIVSTGSGSQDIEIEARRLGAFEVLHKPILDLEKQLFPLVKRAFELYDLTTELAEKGAQLKNLEQQLNELYQFNCKLLRTGNDTNLAATVSEAVKTFNSSLESAVFKKTDRGFTRLDNQQDILDIPEPSVISMSLPDVDLGLSPKTILHPIYSGGTTLGILAIGGLKDCFSTEALSVLALIPALTSYFLAKKQNETAV